MGVSQICRLRKKNRMQDSCSLQEEFEKYCTRTFSHPSPTTPYQSVRIKVRCLYGHASVFPLPHMCE